jgi:hypothetical protein
MALLHEWYRLPDGRESRGEGWTRRARRWIVQRLWMPELAFVLGVVMYLAYQWAAMFMEWPGVL